MTDEKRPKIRCVECNKKLPLIHMSCGVCQGVFCMEHRYPEAHSCKKEGIGVVILPEAVTFCKLQKI